MKKECKINSVKIEKAKYSSLNQRVFDITFEGMTLGQAMSLKSSLEACGNAGSSLAQELFCFIRNAVEASDIPDIKNNL